MSFVILKTDFRNLLINRDFRKFSKEGVKLVFLSCFLNMFCPNVFDFNAIRYMNDNV